jgi:hypothetical protein
MLCVVEATSSTQANYILDRMESALWAMGHQVVRWLGDNMVGNLDETMPRCDAAFVWAGSTLRSLGLKTLWAKSAPPIHFVGPGFFGDPHTYQMDTHGVNTLALWAQKFRAKTHRGRVPVRTHAPLLVLLDDPDQAEADCFSPWFASTHEWLRHMAKYSAMPLVLCLPTSGVGMSDVAALRSHGRIETVERQHMQDAMGECCAVAARTTNDVFHALRRCLPVLSYGHTAYRQPRAVFEMIGYEGQTQVVTGMLARGDSGALRQSVIDQVLHMATIHTHHVDTMLTDMAATLAQSKTLAA